MVAETNQCQRCSSTTECRTVYRLDFSIVLCESCRLGFYRAESSWFYPELDFKGDFSDDQKEILPPSSCPASFPAAE